MKRKKEKSFSDKQHFKKNETPKEKTSEYDKSKRNLFDINDIKGKESGKKKSLWDKIKGIFS